MDFRLPSTLLLLDPLEPVFVVPFRIIFAVMPGAGFLRIRAALGAARGARGWPRTAWRGSCGSRAPRCGSPRDFHHGRARKPLPVFISATRRGIIMTSRMSEMTSWARCCPRARYPLLLTKRRVRPHRHRTAAPVRTARRLPSAEQPSSSP